MKLLLLLTLCLHAALLNALPHKVGESGAFNSETYWKQQVHRYAMKHPNHGDSEEECEILGDQTDEVGPLNAIVDKKKRWTNNVVNYEITENTYGELELAVLRASLEEIEEQTAVDGRQCITFKENSNVFQKVVIKDCGGRECSSFIGMTGNAQRMCLAPRCFRLATIIHEFLHALGFYHEQCRADRDDYVRINFDNIRSGAEFAFRKRVEGKTVDHLGTSYDYGSVMHYGAYSFAVDPTIPTIVPLDPDAIIGQKLGLSELDIERIQILYECKSAAESKYFKHLAGKI